MKHGNKINRLPVVLLTIVALALGGPAFSGCKSSRTVVEGSRTEFHYSGQDSTGVDSVFMGGNERSSQGDTTSISTDGRGSVEIKRDSAGLPIHIYWAYSGNLSAFSKRDTEAQNWFFGLNASRHSETSGAVDYVDEKTEETEEEINTSISLASIIGTGLPGLVLLYLIYLFLTKIIMPWLTMGRDR